MNAKTSAFGFEFPGIPYVSISNCFPLPAWNASVARRLNHFTYSWNQQVNHNGNEQWMFDALINTRAIHTHRRRNGLCDCVRLPKFCHNKRHVHDKRCQYEGKKWYQWIQLQRLCVYTEGTKSPSVQSFLMSRYDNHCRIEIDWNGNVWHIFAISNFCTWIQTYWLIHNE